jgi:hypothetical protein
MFEDIFNNPVFRLVANGYKTGGVFALPKEYRSSEIKKKALLKAVVKNYPQLIAYYHPVNPSFFEFTHRDLFKKKIATHYPDWTDLDPLTIIERRYELFNADNGYEVYYGRFFDIPDTCIKDFSKVYKGSKIKNKFILGLDGNISIAYHTDEALAAAQKYIKKLNSRLKKC